jgi:hypothetical protein
VTLTPADLAQIQAMIGAAAPAGEGFAVPIVAGQTLLIPGIQSPNFSLAGQTGWAIEQNGNAYFFDLDVVGGIVSGPEYLLNNNGYLLYTPSAAFGNLVTSISTQALPFTDDCGNQVLQGTANYVDNAGTYTAIQLWQGAIIVSTAAAAGGPYAVAAEIDLSSGNLQIVRASGDDGYIQACSAGQQSLTVTQTVATQLSESWTVPAGDQILASAYRLKSCGSGAWGSTLQALHFSLTTGGYAGFTVPTSVQTAGASFFWSAEATIVFNSAGNWTLHNTVWINDTAGNQSFVGQGHTNNQAITQPFVFEILANWASTTGAPTITGSIHTYERLNL